MNFELGTSCKLAPAGDPEKVIDISNGIDPQTGKRLKGKAYYYATKDIEVLIDGEIPKEAYTIVNKHH